MQTEVNQESKQRGNSSKQGAEFVLGIKKKKKKMNAVCSRLRNEIDCQLANRSHELAFFLIRRPIQVPNA